MIGTRELRYDQRVHARRPDDGGSQRDLIADASRIGPAPAAARGQNGRRNRLIALANRNYPAAGAKPALSDGLPIAPAMFNSP
jgi:hypothetical protein